VAASAVTDLEARLSEVRSLAQLDPARAGFALSRAQITVSNAINRSCVVLLSAHLEGFLESVVVDAVDAWVSHQTKIGRLPLHLRAAHVDGEVKQMASVTDPEKRLDRLERLFRDHAHWWLDNQPLANNQVDLAIVLGKMSNPNARAIRAFLLLIGVQIDDYLSDSGASGLMARATALVDLRNQIAHGGQDATTTFVDLDAYLMDIETLCAEISRAAAIAVQQTCELATLPW